MADNEDVRDPEALAPLTPAVFHILVSLLDEERHGLGITREVDRRTAGRVWIGPGTLYTALRRMVADGLIEESGRRTAPELSDRRRRYYRLTGFGHRVLQVDSELREEELRQMRAKMRPWGLAPAPRAGDA